MTESKYKRLATIAQIPNHYPLSQSAIRWLISNGEQNGFNKCVRRLGRKILIDLNDFEDWIDGNKAEVK